ncbi:hypothetical protein [Amycolatopsis sp. FDAARGOS 1241]|uniref:hypothetical protein n=1 Tax=Amycolatopsis sp. FDAARGOS 1241 TaxID=2778070 RepID=UPI00194F9847|nr:hypothetical protein [Amycolatopsis sp. FDAARGOS 1241]QRP42938.1 hypothetical protein I6J71_26160 [Amycolatopsis sp. FDAARGOS 1241]
MTRGKKARSRHAQAERSVAAEIQQLRQELEQETLQAAEARAGAERTAEARRQLAEERRVSQPRLAACIAEATRRAEGAITQATQWHRDEYAKSHFAAAETVLAIRWGLPLITDQLRDDSSGRRVRASRSSTHVLTEV